MDRLPYYLHINDVFSINNKDILKIDYREVFRFDNYQDLFVKKSFDRSYLDKIFLNQLETTFGETVSKINLWFWGSSKSNIAHIDCGPDIKEKHPFAINYVLNDEPSSVNWYDINESQDLSIKHGDEKVTGLTIENVTTYIPVDVTNLNSSEQWNSKELTIINTSIPHIIRTDFYRVSVSIQFPTKLTLNDALSSLKLCKKTEI
jgi:hypothetical protein